MTNEKTKIPVRGTIYSNQLPQLSMQMSTNANTNVECNGKLAKYKHIFCRFVQFHIFSFSADSHCPFVQFSTFNIFLADSPHICHHLSHDLFLSWWGWAPLDPDIHVDLCQLFTWPHSAFPHCHIITSTPFYFGLLKGWMIAIKKNISRSWLECIPPLWLGCWLLVRMNKFMRFSKAFPPTYTTGPPLSSTYLTYSSHSLTVNIVHCTTGTDRS